jgi:hypothetical protein
MTGTRQLPGYFNRLLHLLWQILNRGRPTPTNSTGKKPLPKSIAGIGIAQRSSAKSVRPRTQTSTTACSCTPLKNVY